MQFVSLDQAAESWLQHCRQQEQAIHPQGCDQHSSRHGSRVRFGPMALFVQAQSGQKHQRCGDAQGGQRKGLGFIGGVETLGLGAWKNLGFIWGFETLGLVAWKNVGFIWRLHILG